MFRCEDCGEVFCEDGAEYEEVSFFVPYGNGYVKKDEYAMRCPECGSAEISETEEDAA